MWRGLGGSYGGSYGGSTILYGGGDGVSTRKLGASVASRAVTQFSTTLYSALLSRLFSMVVSLAFLFTLC